MATSKPRILVTLEPEDYQDLRDVAKAQGVSMSAILREYVELSRPMLRHMASLSRALESVEEDWREVHSEAVDRAVAKGDAILDLLSGQESLFQDTLETLAGEISGTLTQASRVPGDTVPKGRGDGSRKGGKRSERPPTSNTGVRSGVKSS